MQPTEEMTEKSCIFADNNQRFENMEYKHRIADQILAKKLASKGAILIEGPKWCGKTTTAE